MIDICWSLPLTLGTFFAARWLAAKSKLPLLNPLLLSVAVIVPILLLLHLPYARFFAGSQLLNQLLQPAVVALALPLYEQLPQIRARWRSVLAVCFIGSVSAMLSGTAMAIWLGATPEIAATLLPKSVTTPIAMAISASLRGIPAVSAICVLIAGMVGALFGHTLLNLMRIRDKAARGLAMGNASHALGTARSAENDIQEGAFSSLALVICGVITSLLAPVLFPLLLRLM